MEDGSLHLPPTSHNKSSGQLHIAADGLDVSTDFSRALMADYTDSTASGSKVRTRGHTGAAGSHSSESHRHKHKHKHHNSHKSSQSKSIVSHFPDDTSETLSSSASSRHSVASSISALTRPENHSGGGLLDLPALPSGPTYSPKGDDTTTAVANSRKRKGT